MGFPPFLTSKNCCSSPISPPKCARKLKLGMYIQQVPNMCLLWVSTFQSHFNRSQPQRSSFFVGFFHFYHFFSLFLAYNSPSKLRQEVEICYVYLVRVLNVFDFFGPKLSYAQIEGRGAEESKTQKLPFFNPIVRKSKLV